MTRWCWIAVAATACGSVSSKTDAGPGSGSDAGSGAVAPGTIRWARSLSSIEALGVADGPAGLVVAGSMSAPADLGGGTLTPMGLFDQVIAGYAAEDGAYLYAVRHGAAGMAQEFGFLHTLDPQGSPLVYGVTYGASVDLGKGAVAGGGGVGADGYIGEYSTGNAGWVQRLVGPGEDKIIASAAAPGGKVYGAGWFEQTTMFNGSTLTSAGGRDLFVARFDVHTGVVDLTKTFGGAGREEISTAAAAGDALIIAGMFDGVFALTPVEPIKASAGLDVWVGKLDANGAGLWAIPFGGSGDDRDPRVAVDAAGDVYIAGEFHNQIAFGAVNLVAKGGADMFLAKLRGSDGNVAWAISIGTASATVDDRVGDLVVDAAGHVVLIGTLAGALDGGTSQGGSDALIASFDAATGAQHWQTIISTANDDNGSAIALGRNGDLYACVGLGGAYDFGTPILGAPAPAAVLLRIAP